MLANKDVDKRRMYSHLLFFPRGYLLNLAITIAYMRPLLISILKDNALFFL